MRRHSFVMAVMGGGAVLGMLYKPVGHSQDQYLGLKI